MIYGTETYFSAIERAAWQAGQDQIADLAAAADDLRTEAATELEGMEKERDAETVRAEEAETSLTNLKAAVQERLQAVDTILAQCKRISRRAELEAELQAVYNETL